LPGAQPDFVVRNLLFAQNQRLQESVSIHSALVWAARLRKATWKCLFGFLFGQQLPDGLALDLSNVGIGKLLPVELQVLIVNETIHVTTLPARKLALLPRRTVNLHLLVNYIAHALVH